VYFNNTQAEQSAQLAAFLYDARRFSLTNRAIIDLAPEQVYYSALVFAPTNSIFKQMFKGSSQHFIKSIPDIESSWSSQIQILDGHRQSVTAIACSPDGRQVATGSEDKTVIIWNATTGELQRTLEGHNDDVLSVAFSPNGTMLASGSADRMIRIWAPATGNLVQSYGGHLGAVYSVDFSPDSTLLALSSTDGTVRVWDVATERESQVLRGHEESCRAVAFSPDGKEIASGSLDETIKIWTLATGTSKTQRIEQTTESKFSRYWVNAIAFSPDGKQIASGIDDGRVLIWDVTTGELRTFEGHNGNSVQCIAFSSDGKQVVSGSEDRSIRIWSFATGELQRTFEGHSNGISGIKLFSDGKQMISGSTDNTARLWDLTGDEQRSFKGHAYAVDAISFSSDGKQIVSTAADSTRIWDVFRSELRQTITCELRQAFDGPFTEAGAVAFSQNGNYIAVGSRDGSVFLMNVTTEDWVWIEETGNWVNDIAFSPDSTQFASISLDRTIRVWDVTTGDIFETFEDLEGSVGAVAFSPDGKYLQTEDSVFYLNGTETDPEVAEVEHAIKSNSKIVVDKSWLRIEGQNILGLPYDLRSKCYAVRNNTVAIGCQSGQVICIELNV
jgi:WD40 repeat protein